MRIKIILCMFTQLSASSISAYIYQIYSWHRWNDVLQKYQYVIGLSDFHDKHHPINAEQRAAIEQLISSVHSDGIKLVVEDLSSINACGKKGCGRFTIDSRGGILGGLGEFGEENNIDTANVEYRFCRVAAFGPILNNKTNKPISSLKSTNFVSINALRNEVLNEIENINNELDDYRLQNLCKSKCKQILSHMKSLNFAKNKQLSAGQYFTRYTKHLDSAKKELLSNKLFMFDSDLLDFKLVNEVLKSDKQVIVAVAGGTHIKHMDSLLQKVGFEQLHVSSKSKRKEFDLSQCLGSHIIDGLYCVKPEPVDVATVVSVMSDIEGNR